MFVIERGHDFEFVTRMDIVSFRSLYDTCERLSQIEMMAQARMLCQVQHGGLTKELEKWLKAISPEGVMFPVVEGNSADFKKKFGKGF